MKQSNTKYLISTLLATYGAATALLSVFLMYYTYYTTVLVPTQLWRVHLKPMFLVGYLVFAAVIALAWLIRKKFECSPKWAAVPVMLLGVFTALLPIATPSGLSDLLATKAHWLTPTIVGNGLTAAYIFFIFVMVTGGFSVATLLFRHSYTDTKSGAATVLYPLLFVLIGLSAGVATVLLPQALGYDRMFTLAGTVCAACAVLSLFLGWKKPV